MAPRIHAAMACCILIAKAGRMAAGTTTGQVWLWRVSDRTLLTTLEDHTGPVFAVALSADGRLVVR